jgi:Cu+-exporting ATPase
MSRDSLNIAVAVLGVLLLAAGGSVLKERMRSPAAAGMAVARMAPASAGAGERRVTLEVAGMTCSSCASRVTNQLQGTPGVVACDVDPPAGRAVVVCAADVDDSSLVQAVSRAGKGFTATILAH